MKIKYTFFLFFSISLSVLAQDLTEAQKTRVRNVVRQYCRLITDYSRSEVNIVLRSQIEDLFYGEYNTTTVFDDLKTNLPIQLRDYLDIIRNEHRNQLTFTFNNVETAPIFTAYLSKHPTMRFAQIEATKEIRQLNKTVKNVIIVNLNDFKIWGIDIVYQPFDRTPSSDVIPNVPTNISARVSGSSVVVSWNAVSGAIRYRVYRSNSATGNYQIEGVSTGTSYTDNSPVIGNNFYRVSAISSSGRESSLSSNVSATISRITTPYTPYTPSVTTTNESSMTVKSSIGIKAGMNLSTISNKTNNVDFSPKIKIGFHAGMILDLRFGRKKSIFGLQPELLYSHQGFVFDDDAVSFNYITLPLMAKLNLYTYSGNLYFELGPYFSYLMAVSPNSLEITTEKFDFFSKAIDLNLQDLKNGKDVGVAAGVGYEFDFGLIIGVRYNYGLSDMAKNLQWQNNIALVSVGWKF